MSTGLGVRGLYYGLSEAPRCVLSPSHLTSLGSLYLLERQREAKAGVGSRFKSAVGLFNECSQFQAGQGETQ